MRQTFGGAALITGGAAVPTANNGTSMNTAFGSAMRCAKFMLTVELTGTGSTVVQLHAKTDRHGGKWGIHSVDKMDGVSLAAPGTYHFPVSNFGGYSRVYPRNTDTGSPAAAFFMAEVLEAPTSIGD